MRSVKVGGITAILASDSCLSRTRFSAPICLQLQAEAVPTAKKPTIATHHRIDKPSFITVPFADSVVCCPKRQI